MMRFWPFSYSFYRVMVNPRGHSNRPAAYSFALGLFAASACYAAAPIEAPQPPMKGAANPAVAAESDVQLQSSDTVDAEQARNLLMQQLLRAAEAGIVTMQPSAEALNSSEPIAGTDLEEPDPSLENSQPERPEPIDEPVMLEAVQADADPQRGAAPESAELSPADELTSHLVVKQPKISEVADSEDVATMSEAGASDTPQETATIAVHPPRCFSRAELTLPDVLPGQHLANKIGEQRKALIGEFDLGNSKPAIELAKSYLSVGMLHEARNIIQEFALDDALGQFLIDVTNAWAGKRVAQAGSLFKDECIGVQALWRAYAQARAGDVEAAMKSEISSGAALEELPLHPRQIVAAELGLTAASLGQWDSARRLSAMARRAAAGAQETLGKTHLLSFRLAKWRNEEEVADKHLTLASNSDVDTATEALLIRAEEALRSEDVLDQSQSALRMDLGNLARREIGSEIAKRAFNLEARLFNRQADADETITFLSDAVSLGLLDPEAHPKFLSDLISKPAYSEVARPLALIYLEDPARFDMALEQKELRHSIIRSLAQQGVPGVARGLAQEGDLADAELAVELASSFVDAEEYRDAIATLSKSDSGLKQQLVLGRAFLAMGDYQKAIGALDDIPALEKMSSEDREVVNDLRLEAELAGSDFKSALSTSVEELGDNPNAELALQSAIIALETGANQIPDVAREILSKERSDELNELERLYPLGGSQALSDLNSIEDIGAILKNIESGEKAIREVLGDG